MVTGFEYRVEKGVEVIWGLTVSGYDDEIDGQLDTDRGRLVDIECAMEDLTADHAEMTGAALTRVRGDHGWREYEWDNGAVHRYEWCHGLLDLRCDKCRSPDADLYMVHDELWRSSGMDGWVCFRCFEKAIGRLLVPSDFKPNLPGNTDQTYHCQELRERIGLT